MTSRMGLHSRQYSKVVVFSKYRSDLDAQRPQREVILPFGLLREVDAHLREHLYQKSKIKENGSATTPWRYIGKVNTIDDEVLLEPREPVMNRSVVMEKVIQRRSLMCCFHFWYLWFKVY